MTIAELERAAKALRVISVATHRGVRALQAIDAALPSDYFEEARMHRKLRRIEARIERRKASDGTD